MCAAAALRRPLLSLSGDFACSGGVGQDERLDIEETALCLLLFNLYKGFNLGPCVL